MKTFLLTRPDLRPNHTDHPREDIVLVNENCFCVCDGVALAHQDPYPNPSPAHEAAQKAAQTIATVLGQNKLSEKNPSELLLDAFREANNTIRLYNESKNLNPDTVNFIDRQYAATVCAFGLYQNDILHFGQINDCGVMIFDQYGNREIDFIQNQQAFIKLLTKKEKHGDFEPGSVEEHIFVRREIVNKRNYVFENEPILFGVMTGDPKAEAFFKIGSSSIVHGQLALFYSDGFLPFGGWDNWDNTVI